MSKIEKPLFDAGDRVALVRDRGMLKKGSVGTVTKYNTIRGDLSVSPDRSAHAVFVAFDGVIGMQTVPTADLEKVASQTPQNAA